MTSLMVTMMTMMCLMMAGDPYLLRSASGVACGGHWSLYMVVGDTLARHGPVSAGGGEWRVGRPGAQCSDESRAESVV